MSHPVAVAVALIVSRDGKVLLCQRPQGKSYALQWEFPGGKLEPGESSSEALARELREELEIDAEVGELLHRQVSHYADGGTFAVEYYLVERWSGAMRNMVINIGGVWAVDVVAIDWGPDGPRLRHERGAFTSS